MTLDLKKRLAEGRVCVGAWLSVPSPLVMDAMCTCGFHFAVVDMEHASGGVDHALNAFIAAERRGVFPMARMPNKASHASHVVRICADNPLICPHEVDRLVAFFLEGSCDYAYNCVPRGNRYPDGLGAEIISFDLLEKIHRRATEPSQREHLFNFIWDHEREFRIATFDPKDPRLWHPEIRLDLDTMADYRRLLASGVHIDMEAHECVSIFKEKR